MGGVSISDRTTMYAWETLLTQKGAFKSSWIQQFYSFSLIGTMNRSLNFVNDYVYFLFDLRREAICLFVTAHSLSTEFLYVDLIKSINYCKLCGRFFFIIDRYQKLVIPLFDFAIFLLLIA